MDFEAIKKAAQGYQADMSRFLRDMISHPSESCQEKEVVMCIKAEMEKLGYDKVEIDGLGNVIGWMGQGENLQFSLNKLLKNKSYSIRILSSKILFLYLLISFIKSIFINPHFCKNSFGDSLSIYLVPVSTIIRKIIRCNPSYFRRCLAIFYKIYYSLPC